MSEWQPFETAPKDGSRFLGLATGADGRPMRAIISWTDPTTMFSAKIRFDPLSDRCEWLGEMGMRFGVPFTHWMPLPEPPVKP